MAERTFHVFGDTPEEKARASAYLEGVREEMDKAYCAEQGKRFKNHSVSSEGRVTMAGVGTCMRILNAFLPKH